MYRVDIIISNSRHHCEMGSALARWMKGRGGYQLRVLSLCEFRGTETPEHPLGAEDAEVIKLSQFRRPRTAKSKRKRRLTRISRTIGWYALLAGNVRSVFASHPDLVIMFNDGAFPYERICRVLRKESIPFLLVQEGIRFEVDSSAEDGEQVQGRGGANAIAAFGESSADFFRRRGAPADTIHLTGNPRFDRIRTADLEPKARRIQDELALGHKTLLFLSNPIEFFGYCTVEKKLALVREFVLAIDELFNDEEFRLLFKLHGHENPDDFLEAVSVSPHLKQIVIGSQYELYPLFLISEAAVMFGTTAGLEALLYDVPLGVIEIPEIGFLHDYVAEGAAVGIRWHESLPEQVTGLLELKGKHRPSVERYLDRTLAVRDRSAERIGELIENLVCLKTPLSVRTASRA